MSFVEAIILGIVQGITEFLPISSSGHLVLVEKVMNLNVEGLKAFDVMVHVGTLLAILVYFWKDIVMLVEGLLTYTGTLKKNTRRKEGQKFVELIIIGTIPAVIIGLFLGDTIDYFFRNTLYVGFFMIIMSQIFFIVEHYYKSKSPKLIDNASKISYLSAIYIGIAQAFALIPGVSRSGITISTGMLRQTERSQAARFSFLLGIPAIFGAGLLTGVKIFKSGDGATLLSPEYLVGFVAAAISGYISIYFLMKFLKKHSLRGFAFYLLVIGIITLLLR
jgi:undecaprenyl-diphosphatase